MSYRDRHHLILAACGIVFLGSINLAAADEKKLGWADTAELSYVLTGGNSESRTLGFKDKLTRTWEHALFVGNAGGIRAKSTIFTREVDTNGSLLESRLREVTAENYFLNGRYDRDITLHFFWNAGAGWERNRFAGVENRTTVFGGLGNNWVDTDALKWRTTYAATYTDQQDLVETPGVNSTFLGARVTSDFQSKFLSNSQFNDDLILDLNLDETQDYRANWTNSVTVSMSSHLGLKVSLQFLFDNRPSFEDVPVVDATTGAATGSMVAFELDKVDTIFTTSLVVNY